MNGERATRDGSLTVDQAVDAVEEWMRIKDDNGQTELNWADASHSVLLRRLLRGERPLPYPPPRSYSSPDYDLAENGGLVEAWVPDDTAHASMEGHVVINQCAEWEQVRDGVVRWPPSGREYRLEELSEKEGVVTHRLTPMNGRTKEAAMPD